MKFLIIGDAGSIFVKQYIEYVLLDDNNNEVIVLQEGFISPDYLGFYNKNNVKIEPLATQKTRLIMKIPIVRSIVGTKIWCREMRKKYGRFDFAHVHGLNRARGNIAKYLRKSTDRLAISVWGDEIFRVSENTLLSYRKYYNIADYITLSTKAMYDKFIEAYDHSYDNKLYLNKFAIGEFDFIDRAREQYTRDEICREFGVDSSKRLVYVGHNGRSAQRHFELTKALNKLNAEERSRICLVYTMTYGVQDSKYLEELEREIKALDVEYVILREFLNEEKIAKLRIICDILLHAQLTDAFSASIQESLYSGAIVFNGSWLPYTDLPQDVECMIEYSDFDEMILKLRDVLDNYDFYIEKFKLNRDILRSISSTEVTTRAWKQSLGIK